MPFSHHPRSSSPASSACPTRRSCSTSARPRMRGRPAPAARRARAATTGTSRPGRPTSPGRHVVAVCQRGPEAQRGRRPPGCATPAPLAEVLEGGFVAWARGRAAAGARRATSRRATRRAARVWVTRARPKVDRIACPWLIRRFVDPGAVFLFVAAAEVPAVAERFGATPFDIEGVFWSHRGERCTFDVMLEEFGLRHAGAATAWR